VQCSEIRNHPILLQVAGMALLTKTQKQRNTKIQKKERREVKDPKICSPAGHLEEKEFYASPHKISFRSSQK
jgi:hypothetical protein